MMTTTTTITTTTTTTAMVHSFLQRLVAVVNKAKAANMPKDKIEAAIRRGVEGKDGQMYA